VGVNVFAADTDEEAAALATSHQQAFVNLRSGRPGRLPPPKPGLQWGTPERAMLSQVLTCSAVGSPKTVRKWLAGFLAETRADELIIAGQIYDHAARLRSYELTADALRSVSLS
jgi:alkanesulfonate monooxygenase SsuD/methylene tetrahydromethanopterin reductase-like flavin-dependent oxidoreductase (luciferase family)